MQEANAHRPGGIRHDDPSPVGAIPKEADGRRVVYLLDTPTSVERRIVADWRASRPPGEAGAQLVLLGGRARRRDNGSVETFDAVVSTDDDPLLVPLRVIWVGASNEQASEGLWRLLLLGDPHAPNWLRKHWIRRFRPERVRVIAGEPATLSELRRRWHELGGTDRAETSGLAEFVRRQAALALDRSERRIRGMRYKVPRFVADEILQRAGFRGGLARMAWESGRDLPEVTRQAAGYLKEIAASHRPYIIDLTAGMARVMYTRGYRERINYDLAALEHTYALGQRSAVVFLPSHKSNLDSLVLRRALYENGHPPNHTAGGINMNFALIGPLLRRSGVFFIRRTFKDDAVYKFVLGQYIDYLVEKRFPLEWYIEGGRSRSGKLLPPRFGLLAYVVDAYRRGKSDDVWLIPVSIAYDQIHEVRSYVSEQRGGAKEQEGLGWLLRVFRKLKRRYGEVYIRFGEPLSLRETLGPPAVDVTTGPDEKSIVLQKLAFEVSTRINRATPVTATSLVTLALLGAGDRALSLTETSRAVAALVSYVRQRRLECTAAESLGSDDGVATVLGSLVDNGIVTSFSGGPEVVHAIRQDEQLAAAYYRNTVIHYFVNAAIVELSLLGSVAAGGDVLAAFWREAYALRDLLKFEFFFADRERFRGEIADELALHDPRWETALAGSQESARELLLSVKPLTSFLVLRPFLESYRVVADVLRACPDTEKADDQELLRRCLGLGKQYHLQKRIRNGESVSNVYFANGLRLARNRSLVGVAGREGSEARAAFAEEIAEIVRRIDAIEALAAGRRTGLLD
jgi:glycerol-3-phosphate O-acyltransferase